MTEGPGQVESASALDISVVGQQPTITPAPHNDHSARDRAQEQPEKVNEFLLRFLTQQRP
jgi:hypothetical protein